MKTMFDMGLRPSGMFFGSPAGAALGQVRLRGASLGGYDVSQADRDDALARINAEQQKYDVVHGWIAAYQGEDALVRTMMGGYYQNFLDASTLAEEKAGVVDFIYRSFGPDDTASWGLVSPKDLGYLDDWALAIERMYNTIVVVDPSYLTAPISRKNKPGVTPGTVPIKPITNARGIATPANTILGMTPQTATIAGIAAVGLGVLFYALS